MTTGVGTERRELESGRSVHARTNVRLKGRVAGGVDEYRRCGSAPSPGALSTPEDTSTICAPDSSMARATLSGSSPPARTRAAETAARQTFQSKAAPWPPGPLAPLAWRRTSACSDGLSMTCGQRDRRRPPPAGLDHRHGLYCPRSAAAAGLVAVQLEEVGRHRRDHRFDPGIMSGRPERHDLRRPRINRASTAPDRAPHGAGCVRRTPARQSRRRREAPRRRRPAGEPADFDHHGHGRAYGRRPWQNQANAVKVVPANAPRSAAICRAAGPGRVPP